MFYAHFVLSKKGPFSRIWLAAHWDKKLTRAHVFETNINSSVEAILEPRLKMALRTSGHLLLGVVRIYSRKAKYLLADCNEIYVKIKTSFRPGVVDLPDESNREAALAAITLPENMQDYEATMADLTAINLNTMAINLSRPEDITMNEEVCDINLGRQDDDFGDLAFEELPSREMLRDGSAGGYDSVYGRATDVPGRYSVRDSDRPSIRPEIVGDDTLIGVDSHHDDKISKDVHPSLVGEMDLDDDAFPDYGPDSNDSFGGDIDHNLFNSSNLFEDPSAHKQLDQISSEFDTNVRDLGLPTEGEKEQDEKDRTGDHRITSMAAEVLALHDQHQQNGPLTHEESNIHRNPPQVQRPMQSMTPMSRDNITLLSNESEAFALQPIDVTATITEPRRVAKRKRRLIIDESKSIPSELMKIQMQETAEITAQLDLAPPTKRLMHMKETGGLDKLFTLPGRAIPSRVLQRLFTRNLHSHLPLPEEAQEDLSSISAIYRPANASLSGIEQSDMISAGATTHLDLLRTPRTGFSAGLQMTNVGDADNHGGLDAIPEDLEELNETISRSRSGFPSATAELHQQFPAGERQLEQLHDPFLAVATRPTDIPDHHSVGSNDLDDDDNNDHCFSLMGPASVLSPTSHEMMGGLEQELAAREDHHVDLHMGAPFSADDGVDDYDDQGEPSVVEAVDEAEDILEERRLERRSKDMLRRLRAHIAVHGWGENGISLTAMCDGNTKMQAASKFYTALLLRKQGSVLLSQGEPFTDIRLNRGPLFVGPGGPNVEP